MAPIHPFAPSSSTKFDSLFDEQPTNNNSPISLREGSTVPDFRNRSAESNEDLAFEYFFEQAGGNVTGALSGDRAVPFFQRSGLDSNTLYKIWQLSDSNGEGILRLSGFKVAMKLIALAQSQLPVSIAYIREACPLPIFEGIRVNLSRPKTGPEGLRLGGRTSSLSRSSPFDSSSPFDRLPSSSWNQNSQGQSISLTDSQKYYRIFRKASFNQDFLDGNAVRDIMMKSGLAVDILRDIWNLADTQDRGFLEAFEFIIAMYYVENFMNETISDVPILLPLKIKESAILAADSFSSPYPNASRQANFTVPASRSMYLGSSSERNAPMSNSGLNINRDPIVTSINNIPSDTISEPSWAIPQADITKYYGFFDSIVSVPTALMPSDNAYVFFIKSQLPSPVLSQIWELATIENQNGLSRDEFAVAMHLIYSQLAGQALPSQLPLNLIPPRFRKKDPYSQDTPGNTLPFDPFIDNVTGRQSTLRGVNNPNISSFEPAIPQSSNPYSKTEDLLSFDEPTEPLNSSTINSNSNLASQSNSIYKPASYNQTRDLKDSQNELAQNLQSFNNQRPSVVNNQDLSTTLPSQHPQFEHRYNHEPMEQPGITRDGSSAQNSFQNIRSENNTSQEQYYKQHQSFPMIQETHQQKEKQNFNDLPRSQKVEEFVQDVPQKIPRFSDQVPALSMFPETNLNPVSLELIPPPTLSEESKTPDTNQDLDPFAALIENRTQSIVINEDSNEKVASKIVEADPFSDPTLEFESKQGLPQISSLIKKQNSLKEIKHLGSFDEIIAHRSVESHDTKSRFASFDDIALRDTVNDTDNQHKMVSESLADFTEQVVSSPTINDLPSSSKISLPIETSPQLEHQVNNLQSFDEVPPSSFKHPGSVSQNTPPNDDPFLALVQSVESKPADFNQTIDIPNESIFPSSGSVIFSAFEDSAKESQNESTSKINTSEKLASYLASVDLQSWSKTNLDSSGTNVKSPALTYIFSHALFEVSTLEFPPPKPMASQEALLSLTPIQKEIILAKLSKAEPVSNDPFAHIVNRTDPFDLPEATLDKMAKRASAAASLRFDDAFGDDFSTHNKDVSAEKTTVHDLEAVDHNVAIDPSQIALPISSNSLSLPNIKDPSSPEACRSASLYFDADDINSSQFSASSAADMSISSPQASDAISILIAMGFPPNAAADALARFDNDTDKATHYLLDNQTSPSIDALTENH